MVPESCDFCSVQLLSRVQLFATPRMAACQASLSLTNSQSLLKLMCIKSVMPSNHFILCHPLLLPQSFPSSGSFQMSQFFASGSQSIGVSAAASVLLDFQNEDIQTHKKEDSLVKTEAERYSYIKGRPRAQETSRN